MKKYQVSPATIIMYDDETGEEISRSDNHIIGNVFGESLESQLEKLDKVKCNQCGAEHYEISPTVIKVTHKRTGVISYYCNNGFCAIAQQLGTIGF
jgi:hypothetical protein